MEESAGDDSVAGEIRDAERLSAKLSTTTRGIDSFEHKEEQGSDDAQTLAISSFPLSSSSPASLLPSLSCSDARPNRVQVQWRLGLPDRTAPKPRTRVLPLSRVPSLAPLAYHLRTTSSLSLTRDTSLSLTPSVVASPSTLSTALSIALTSALSPSLSSSISFCLSAPSSFSLSLLHTASAHSTALHVSAERDGLRVGGRWKRRLGGGELVLEGEGAQLGGVAWEWGAQEDGEEVRGAVGVRWLRGLLECSVRLSRPLHGFPPLNRVYVHSAAVFPATAAAAAVFSSGAPPSTAVSHVDLRQRPDRLAMASHQQQLYGPVARPLPSFPSFSSTARLSLEVGVTANINRLHKVDVGLGWSPSGLYAHFAFTSASSTWSFPVYVASPDGISPFALCVYLPVSVVFAYAAVVSPLHRLYRRKTALLPSPSSLSDAEVYRHVMQPVARLRQAASPSLVLVCAQYGWAFASSTRTLRPSHPLFRWSGDDAVGAVEWAEVRDIADVLGCWMKDGRLLLTDGRKAKMLGMERMRRPKALNAPLVLGVYMEYTSLAVRRHVFIGEREGCVLPSTHHKRVREG